MQGIDLTIFLLCAQLFIPRPSRRYPGCRCLLIVVSYGQNTRINVTLLLVTPEAIDSISRLIFAQDRWQPKLKPNRKERFSETPRPRAFLALAPAAGRGNPFICDSVTPF